MRGGDVSLGDAVGKSSLRQRNPLLAELLIDQVPLALGTFLLGIAASYWLYGFLPGADHSFPVAGIRVPLWHLVWMGFWTGYIMAIVGQAAGLFALSYSISILRFDNLSLSPTSLVITLINPFGALLGFWRGKQWNLDLTVWLCAGAVFGAPLGPFVRVYLVSDPVSFKAFVGVVLAIMAAQLWLEIIRGLRRNAASQRAFSARFDESAAAATRAGKAPSGLNKDFRIATLERSLMRVKIGYYDQDVTLHTLVMVLIGFVVGLVGTALGIGGGFLLVPILVVGYRLPMYVIVAASIPFVIVLSLVGLLSYNITLPLLTGITTPPDWAFGFFAASGATFGAWLAAKTQRFVPERYLKPMLGALTGLVGGLYIVNYFWPLPFHV